MLFQVFGPIMASIIMIPIAVSAWQFDVRGGLGGGVIGGVLTIFLEIIITPIDLPLPLSKLFRHIFVTVLITIFGGILGWARFNYKQLILKTKELEIAKNQALTYSTFKNEFIAKITHELRTPLTVINGIVESLLTDDDIVLIEKSLFDKLKVEPSFWKAFDGKIKYLGMLQRANETLSVVINDILDFSQLKFNKIQLKKRNFDIEDLIKRFNKSFKRILP